MSKICFGCGAKLQSVNKDKDGYVPEDKLMTSEYCQRCFKIIHYGIYQKNTEPKKIREIINSVNKNAEFAVFMTDFINVFDDVIKIFKSIRVPKVLVISKSDIIPKSVSFSQIKNYMREVYGIKDGIVFTSSKTNLNTFLKGLYGKKEIYFLGLTNAGKSTLINTIMDKFESENKRIATSFKENTTLDFIRIKLGNMTLIDSPGFLVNNFELDKNTNINNEIKPITYQNKVTCTYDVGSLFKIRFEGLTNLVFYFSKSIKINRLFNKEIIGISFKVDGNRDIVICGLGFIKVTGNTKITIPSELMKYINIRPSITGGKYE